MKFLQTQSGATMVKPEDAVEEAVYRTLMLLGFMPETICKAEGRRRFKSRTFDNWLRLGLLEPIKTGPNNSKVEYSLIECMRLSKQPLNYLRIANKKK